MPPRLSIPHKKLSENALWPLPGPTEGHRGPRPPGRPAGLGLGCWKHPPPPPRPLPHSLPERGHPDPGVAEGTPHTARLASPLRPGSAPQNSGCGGTHSQARGAVLPPHPGLARPGPTPPPRLRGARLSPSLPCSSRSDKGVPTVTILVCPVGAVRIEGGSGGRALLGGRPVLTPGSRPGVCGCGRCRGGDGGGGALEGRERTRAWGCARRRPGPRRQVDGASGRAVEDAQCAAPRGPERSPFPTKISAALPSAVGPRSGLSGAGCRVPSVGSLPLARPPSLPPARAARSALWVAPPPPPALYSGSCQRRRRSLAGSAGPRLLPAPDGAAGGSECVPADSECRE